MLAPRRYVPFLVSGFAFLALSLAAAGIHGVVAYSVNRRRREIGVRMALGALVLVGLILDAIGALAGSRFIGGMLYGIRAADPVVLVSCAAIMLSVGAAAAWLPHGARLRSIPIEALPSE